MVQINQAATEWIMDIFGLSEHRGAIAYQVESSPDAAITIIPAAPEEEKRPTPWLPELPLPELEGIPILYGTPQVEQRDGRWIVHADLIASAFFLLTRYEEILRRDVRDQHGRFPGRESLPYRAGFLPRPVVDEYAKLIRSWLRQGGLDVPEPPATYHHVYLTHDTDQPYAWNTFLKAGKGMVKSLLCPPRGTPLRPWRAWLGADALDRYNCYDWIFAQDQQVQKTLGPDRASAIHFMMSGGSCRQDGYYRIDDPRIGRLMQRMQDAGAEIGLHASYEAGMKPEQVQAEAEILRRVSSQAVTSNRNHFLCTREPEDMQALVAAGITDDFTMAYAEAVGFRVGTCRPYFWFDPVAMTATNLQIHPMTIMECTLEHPQYMGLDLENAIRTATGLLEQVEAHHGDAVLLWHNTEFTEVARDAGAWHRKLYTHLLQTCFGDS